MHAWLCENPTGVEALNWKEIPTPTPGPKRSWQSPAFWGSATAISTCSVGSAILADTAAVYPVCPSQPRCLGTCRRRVCP